VEAMDGLCESKCGKKYTDYLVSLQQSKCRGSGGKGTTTTAQQLLTWEEGGKAVAGSTTTTTTTTPSTVLDWVNDLVSDVITTTTTTYHPPTTFPGLSLGCVKDDDDNYCAVKEADEENDGCDFYLSCCYGEWLVGREEEKKKVGDREEKCPGSKAFATKRCPAL